MQWSFTQLSVKHQHQIYETQYLTQQLRQTLGSHSRLVATIVHVILLNGKDSFWALETSMKILLKVKILPSKENPSKSWQIRPDLNSNPTNSKHEMKVTLVSYWLVFTPWSRLPKKNENHDSSSVFLPGTGVVNKKL